MTNCHLGGRATPQAVAYVLTSSQLGKEKKKLTRPSHLSTLRSGHKFSAMTIQEHRFLFPCPGSNLGTFLAAPERVLMN